MLQMLLSYGQWPFVREIFQFLLNIFKIPCSYEKNNIVFLCNGTTFQEFTFINQNNKTLHGRVFHLATLHI